MHLKCFGLIVSQLKVMALFNVIEYVTYQLENFGWDFCFPIAPPVPEERPTATSGAQPIVIHPNSAFETRDVKRLGGMMRDVEGFR